MYDFNDYKRFILATEAAVGHFQRGFRTRAAESMGCQSAFVSQVLNGKAHLSLEQALRLATFLQLDRAERRYFVTLVEYARAGDDGLKAFFQDHLREQQDARLEIRQHVGAATELSQEAQTVYYGQWYFAAIHILCTIPRYQTPDAIADALGLNALVVSEALVFLLQQDLLREAKGKIIPGNTQIHLARSSSNLARHHTNWRLAAVQSLGHPRKSDVHYSAVSSLSGEDAAAFERRFVALVQEYVEKVRESKEERLYCFNLDFFQLVRD